MNTVRLIGEQGGFAYVSDSYADDLPYWRRFGDRDQLMVPYTLDANDMRFAIQPRACNAGASSKALSHRQFRLLYAEGFGGRAQDAVDRPALPPDRASRRGRWRSSAFLDHMAGHRGRLVRHPPRRSPSIGRGPIRRRARSAPPRWTARPSSRNSAASSSIPPGSPNAPMGWSLGRAMTPRRASIRRWPACSAAPRPRNGWACCARIPIWRASWQRPGG
jgi:hypothetical protein